MCVVCVRVRMRVHACACVRMRVHGPHMFPPPWDHDAFVRPAVHSPRAFLSRNSGAWAAMRHGSAALCAINDVAPQSKPGSGLHCWILMPLGHQYPSYNARGPRGSSGPPMACCGRLPPWLVEAQSSDRKNKLCVCVCVRVRVFMARMRVRGCNRYSVLPLFPEMRQSRMHVHM